ncbi:hypothetical protein MKX01_028803, partial [Papaver californicum]
GSDPRRAKYTFTHGRSYCQQDNDIGRKTSDFLVEKFESKEVAEVDFNVVERVVILPFQTRISSLDFGCKPLQFLGSLAYDQINQSLTFSWNFHKVCY